MSNVLRNGQGDTEMPADSPALIAGKSRSEDSHRLPRPHLTLILAQTLERGLLPD